MTPLPPSLIDELESRATPVLRSNLRQLVTAALTAEGIETEVQRIVKASLTSLEIDVRRLAEAALDVVRQARGVDILQPSTRPESDP